MLIENPDCIIIICKYRKFAYTLIITTQRGTRGRRENFTYKKLGKEMIEF